MWVSVCVCGCVCECVCVCMCACGGGAATFNTGKLHLPCDITHLTRNTQVQYASQLYRYMPATCSCYVFTTIKGSY